MTKSKIKQIQKNVEGSLAIEGIYPSEEAKKINTRFLQGKINSKQAIQRIKALYIGC